MRILTASLFVILAFPTIASAQTKWFDLTPAFLGGSVDADHLLVSRVGGIAVMRGTTDDVLLCAANRAEGRTGQAPTGANGKPIAAALAYDRVVNLMGGAEIRCR